MAVLRNGPNGGFSGKVGSIIGYQLNGQDIIRGWPKVRKKRKVSKLEQANRDKFAIMQKWLKPLLGILRVGFKDYAPTYQGFVAAKSYNSKHALKQQEDGTHYIDPAFALVSFGTLKLPDTMSMERIDDNIIFSWSTQGHFVGIDQAMVLAYIPETAEVKQDLAVAKRSAGTATLSMPKNPKRYDVHVYIAFVSYDHTQQSNSQYLGSLKMA